METLEQEETKRVRYKWYRDPKMKSTTILIATVVIMIFGFLKVPVITTIHSYTVGAIMGFYSPLFYLFVIIQCFRTIFDDKLTYPSWIKVNKISFWFIVMSIIAVGTSAGFYQGKGSFTEFGSDAWKTFDTWWADWTDHNTVSGWYPNNTNGGIFGAFYYSMTSMCISGIGSFILSIFLLILSLSIVATGSFFQLYRSLIRSNKHSKQKQLAEQKTITAIPIADTSIDDDKDEENNEEKNLPFDDPF